MEAISYSEFRKDLARNLKKVNESHSPLLITRSRGGDAAVVLSQDDYNSLQETLYLLSSPKNNERLNQSLEDLKNNNYQSHELSE